MIARMQQAWAVGTVLVLALWCLWAWPRSPVLAGVGLALPGLGLMLVMGSQFAWMHRANARDAAPRAHPGQVWRAWWVEMGTALQVFGWRQPFRSPVQPDWLPAARPGQPPRGVVLVHGFQCNRAVWLPWFARLRAGGHAYVAVNLEPVFGSIDTYAPLIDAAVQRVADATGRAPVLVCHSMGGLAARAWLRAFEADARVHRVITLGTPHGGTLLAELGHAHNGQQMRCASPWLVALQASESAARARLFTCWYSNCDNIVFPASTAVLAGSTPRFIDGVAHVQMALHPQVMDACLQQLANDSVG